jgi:Tol biopolymer transport system component/DNA-binding winged helix-turn-helix (wHTH) protein
MEAFRIAGRLIDPSLNRVTAADGTTVQVEPKVMSVLVALAERPGEVVTRDQLMSSVWSGVFVSDDALHRTIREIRRLFGDDAERPRIVETIRKRGYRLIASIETEAKEDRSGNRPEAGSRASLFVGAMVVLVAMAAATRFTLSTETGRARPLGVAFGPFTSDPGNEVQPALSGTGKLAYVARGGDGRAHIFMKSSREAAAVQITRGPGSEHAPAWSPDENALAFVRMDDSGCHIVVADVRGEHDRVVTPCLSREEFKMSWSPDAAVLAITAGDGRLSSPSHIELLTVASGRRRPVTTPEPGMAGDYEPAFSPDGKSIAFVRVLSGSATSLCVTRLDHNGEVVSLTDFDADVLGVDWDPSGRYLIFSSDRAGAISIWRIDVDVAYTRPPARDGDETFVEPELLAGGGNKLKHPSVARRSGAIAYEDWQYEINLRERSTSAAGDGDTLGSPISPTADRWNFHPQISPDGKRIAFQSTRSGTYELWVGNRDGSGARQLTRSQQYKSMARWSPDSRQLVFASRSRSGAKELRIVDADTGDSRVVGGDGRPIDFIAPNWSHDGTVIHAGGVLPPLALPVSESSRATPVVWDVDVKTGERSSPVYGPAAAIESSDGQWLFTATLFEPGLVRMAQNSHDRVTITDRVTVDQWPNWGVYDRGVYYVDYPDQGEPQLFFVETGHREPRAMTRLPDMAWPGIAVSRDGARVIYARADRRSSNIGGLMAR